jgi:hypothetical protein
MQYLTHVMRTASPAQNRYLNLCVYSQTLASWEWDYLIEGPDSPDQLKQVPNPVYATYRRAVHANPAR